MPVVMPPWRLTALHRIKPSSLNFEPLSGQMTPIVILLLSITVLLCVSVHWLIERLLLDDSEEV